MITKSLDVRMLFCSLCCLLPQTGVFRARTWFKREFYKSLAVHYYCRTYQVSEEGRGSWVAALVFLSLGLILSWQIDHDISVGFWVCVLGWRFFCFVFWPKKDSWWNLAFTVWITQFLENSSVSVDKNLTTMPSNSATKSKTAAKDCRLLPMVTGWDFPFSTYVTMSVYCDCTCFMEKYNSWK